MFFQNIGYVGYPVSPEKVDVPVVIGYHEYPPFGDQPMEEMTSDKPLTLDNLRVSS